MCTHTLSRVLQHQLQPPSQGRLQGCNMSNGSGSRLPDRKDSDATTCTIALDPTSLQRRALVHHVSYSSGSCLPLGKGSGAPRVPQLRILPPYREGSGASTTCRVASCGLRVSSIKKGLAGLPRIARITCSQCTHTYFQGA
jgi:hypothetical protein